MVKINVIHGDAPKKIVKGSKQSLFMFLFAKYKALIAESRKNKIQLDDKKTCRVLGISFTQVQELKQFAILNGMKIK